MKSSVLYTDFSNIDINIVFVIKSHSQRCCMVEPIIIYHYLISCIWQDFELSRIHSWISFYSSWPRNYIASKLFIQLVHNNNHLVDTFICSWLSSYIVVYIWCVIDLNHTLSRLDSWRTFISTWFEEVITDICFIDRPRYYCASTCKQIAFLRPDFTRIR